MITQDVLKGIFAATNTELAIDAARKDMERYMATQTKTPYHKDVSGLDTVDVYRVLRLFEVTDHAIGHAVKKLLCAGERGYKDQIQDVTEARDALNRWIEMIREDGNED